MNPDCSWYRLHTPGSSDDFYVVSKVGMFSVDLDEVEYSYAGGKHRLSLAGKYNNTAVRFLVHQADAEFQMPSADEMLQVLVKQLQSKATRPRTIATKLRKDGIRDATFRMFALAPMTTHSDVVHSRTVAGNLEKGLRLALSAYQPLHQRTIKGLGMKGTSDGPTEWIVSSTKLIQAVTDLYSQSDGSPKQISRRSNSPKHA